MKYLLYLLMAVTLAGNSQAWAQKTASMNGHSLSIALNQGTNGTRRLLFTTYDGSRNTVPKNMNLGGLYVGRELQYVTGSDYYADYFVYNNGLFQEYGTFKLTANMADGDNNGFPDYFQREKLGNLSIFTSRQQDNPSQTTFSANAGGLLTRAAGSATGTYQITLPGPVTYNGTYFLPHWTGSMTYERNAQSNKFTLNLTYFQPNGGSTVFTGSTNYYITNNSLIGFPQFKLTNTSDTTKTITVGAAGLTRATNTYQGYVTLSDGEFVTTWADYPFHLFAFTDLNDSNGNGVPDLTDTYIPPPTIIRQPTNIVVNAGQNATFSVHATNALGYQWLFGNEPLIGANATNLTITGAQTVHEGNYSVIITNAGGSVTSTPASLTIRVAPQITEQPVGQTVNQGANVTFSVTATGTAPLAYFWRFNGDPIPTANGQNYTITNVRGDQAGNYSVTVSNAAGTVTSSLAALVVRIPPTITAHPQSKFVEPGANTSFTVTATGTAPLSYQWRRNNQNVGGNSATLTLNGVQPNQAGEYDVVVSNAAGSATSNPATLTVGTAPTITGHPQSQTVAVSSNVTFTVTATGSATLQYQWRFQGTNIAGATAAALTLNNVQVNQAGSYDVVVSNTVGVATSNPAILTVGSGPVITQQPVSQTVEPGTNVTFSVVATGSALNYQWIFNGTPLSGSTSSTLTITNVQTTNAGTYSVTVSNSVGTVNSSNVALLVLQDLLAGSRLENGSFQLRLSGAQGKNYAIEITTNLVNWIELTRFNNVSGTIEFTDPPAENRPQRFYRAREVN